MEKSNHPIKRHKRNKVSKKFKCELCERIVMNPRAVQTRKNYPHGKKSKPMITKIHRQDGGVLIELKTKKKERK